MQYVLLYFDNVTLYYNFIKTPQIYIYISLEFYQLNVLNLSSPRSSRLNYVYKNCRHFDIKIFTSQKSY